MRATIANRTIVAAQAALLSVGLLLAGCSKAAPSSEAASAPLDRMLAAERTLSYKGTKELVYPRRGGMQKKLLTVTHYPDGPTVIDTVGRHGEKRHWVRAHSRFYWLHDRALLLRNYRIREDGSAVVAGRKGAVWSVRSVHAGRPSLRFVVDGTTGLLMESDLTDWRGKSSVRSRFVSIVFDPKLPPAPAVTRWGHRWHRHGKGGPAPTFAAYLPQYLPVGFVKTREFRFRHGRGGIWTTYSDGLSLMTVFERPAAAGAKENVIRSESCGSVSDMSVTLNKVTIHLRGHLAPKTLVKVLKSLARKANS